jgi:hypothetical protein
LNDSVGTCRNFCKSDNDLNVGRAMATRN